jgi:hypothetical protein
LIIVFFVEIDQVSHISSFIGAVPCKMFGLPAPEAVIMGSWLVGLRNSSSEWCSSSSVWSSGSVSIRWECLVSHGSWGVGVVNEIEAAGESRVAGSGARGAERLGETDGVGEGWTVLWKGGGDGDVTRDRGDAGVGGVGEACEAGTGISAGRSGK